MWFRRFPGGDLVPKHSPFYGSNMLVWIWHTYRRRNFRPHSARIAIWHDLCMPARPIDHFDGWRWHCLGGGADRIWHDGQPTCGQLTWLPFRWSCHLAARQLSASTLAHSRCSSAVSFILQCNATNHSVMRHRDSSVRWNLQCIIDACTSPAPPLNTHLRTHIGVERPEQCVHTSRYLIWPKFHSRLMYSGERVIQWSGRIRGALGEIRNNNNSAAAYTHTQSTTRIVSITLAGWRKCHRPGKNQNPTNAPFFPCHCTSGFAPIKSCCPKMLCVQAHRWARGDNLVLIFFSKLRSGLAQQL